MIAAEMMIALADLARALVILALVAISIGIGRAWARLIAEWRAELQRRTEERAREVAMQAMQVPTRPFIWTRSRTQEEFDRDVERFNARRRVKLLRCERPKLPPAPREDLHTEGPYR